MKPPGRKHPPPRPPPRKPPQKKNKNPRSPHPGPPLCKNQTAPALVTTHPALPPRAAVRAQVTHAILKNHQRRWLRRIVLRRDVNSAVPDRPWEHRRIRKLKSLYPPMRHLCFELRIRSELVIIRSLRSERSQ